MTDKNAPSRLAPERTESDEQRATVSRREKEENARSWLESLMRRANGGDETALRHLRTAADKVPGLWRVFGDVQDDAEERLLDAIACPRTRAVEHMAAERSRDQLREQLLAEGRSMPEVLVVDQIVLTWLDLMAARRTLSDKMETGTSIGLEDFYDRRIERALRRLLLSIKTLAVIRKAGAPSQVNIADTIQQVNLLT